MKEGITEGSRDMYMGSVGLKCGIAQPLTAHDIGALRNERKETSVHSVRILSKEMLLRGVKSFIKDHRAMDHRDSTGLQREVIIEAVPDLPLQDLAIIRLDRNEKGKEGGRKDT